ncbi:MAG: hypothetical protein U0I78_03550 [Collinsella aerofaciens]|nr:hypothetical protein [Collinsella aerofaciens]
MMGLELLPAITKANREDTLEELLGALGMSDLLESDRDPYEKYFKGKIIVIGASAVKVDKLRSAARKKKWLFGGFCGRDSGIGPAQRAKTTIWN